jgi:3-oxoacyl-[acyl-carrier protein] reductase
MHLSQSDRGNSTVAIVTGGASATTEEVARAIAGWDWAIVLVYLEQQRRVEATVAEILAAGGRTVAVRADLADDLDVERLFAESIAAFGGVDVLVHTNTVDGALVYLQASLHLRAGGAVVSVSGTDGIPPEAALRLRERGIVIGSAPPGAMLAFLDVWRRRLAR